MRRVVITGQGGICALGQSATAIQTAMKAGKSGIGPLAIPDLERLSVTIGAQVRGYQPEEFFSKSELSQYDRTTQFAILAAREAMDMAGLCALGDPQDDFGVILGTAGGGHVTQDENYRLVYALGKNRVPPLTVPRLMNNAAPAHLSRLFGWRGPCYTVSTACASANHAIGQAAALIATGQTEAMLAGGVDAMLTFGGIKAWEGLRVLSPDACRPFCATRNGMVQGEGAGVFVLESYARARARAAPILAEISGFAMSADADDLLKPNLEAISATIARAIRLSKRRPHEVQYVNAHGTGTPLNDKIETAALKSVFGEAVDQIAISSTKSMHGHVMGASGAIELLACLLALNEGVIPPTIGYERFDPECDLDYVTKGAIKKDVALCVSNSFAFGGLNAVLVLNHIDA